MNFLSYKTFVWPHNPHTYREVTTRTPVYSTQSGVTYFEGMSDLKRTITGFMETMPSISTKSCRSSQRRSLQAIWNIRFLGSGTVT